MNNYDDIINTPYPFNLPKPRMSIKARAAQFAPFAALTGFESLTDEAARYVPKKRILTEESKEEIGIKLSHLSQNPTQLVYLSYFVSDFKKNANLSEDDFTPYGTYHTYKGLISKIDNYKQLIILPNGYSISFEDIEWLNIL